MIPINLTMKGIYSYRREQTIDFSRLQEARLFGIFGAVGSGKSTVLEAMTFALYGETERLKQSDNRAYNMMNLKSDELLIRFEFLAGVALDERYLFEVQIKRQKKNFDKLGTPKWRRLKQKDGEWIPEEREAAEIVGLSYENFRRTVIIPQGKFQEFLQLTGSERTRMMKELFSLQRFDLWNKTQRLNSRNNEAVQTINGRLQELEMTPEQRDELQERLQNASKKLAEQVSRLNDLREDERRFKSLFELEKESSASEEAYTELKKQEGDVQRRRNHLQRYEECERTFGAKLEQLDILQVELNRQKSDENAVTEARLKLETDILAEKKAFTRIEELFADKQTLQNRAGDLKRLAELRRLDLDRAALNQKVETQRADMQVITSQLAELLEKTDRQAEHIRNLRKGTPDTALVSEMQEWFSAKRLIDEFVVSLQAEQKRLSDALSQLEEEKTQIIQDEILKDWITPLEKTLPIPDVAKHVVSVYKKLKAQQKKQEKQRLAQLLENHLAGLAEEMSEGDACPLCGSTEHPQLYHSGKAKNMRKLENEFVTLRQQIEALEELQPQLAGLAVGYEDRHEQLVETEERLAEKVLEQEEHLTSWRWKDYLPEDEERIMKQREASREIQETLQTLEQQQEEQLIKRRDMQAQRDEQHEAFIAVERDFVVTETRFTALADQLEMLSTDSLPQNSPDELEREAVEQQEQVNRVQRDHEKGTERLAGLQTRLSEFGGELTTLRKQLAKSEAAFKKRTEELNLALEKSPFTSIDEIRTLLQDELEVALEKSEIDTFYLQLHTAETQMKENLKRMGNQVYDREVHEKLQELISEKTAALAAEQQNVGRLEGELQRLDDGLKKRAELQKEYDMLNLRKENLATLAGLFRKSGFVNYVSSVFLQNLVRAANARFKALTRNQLLLEVNDKNNFMVRDFLNDGQSRSVKTLSGGQTFQASLCLALALADNIQHLSEASQNFFFLDEGFGTLDKNSLQIIFTTLKEMQKENRIVGVISHVEELQQEIDVYLSIVNDDEEGSRVTTSW
ncbi:MAG: SbcC/MukB-like Walker B domain-containing protein [Calditrichia bacterium]